MPLRRKSLLITIIYLTDIESALRIGSLKWLSPDVISTIVRA
jgi:hypothetical protein